MTKEVDVLVIGGGLAGLSAALTSARLGRSTAVLTGGVLGGQLVSIEKIDGVPGFPDGVPGYDLCPMAQEQAVAAGAELVAAAADSLETDGERWQAGSAEGAFAARAVVLATGAAIAPLGVPGEERLDGKGVSRCASCDAPLLRGKTAVVIGGGDSGMQEALTLAEHVARVVLVERGAALSGQASYRERVQAHPRIELRFETVVTEILGDDAVQGVRIARADGGGAEELPADGVFPFPGLVPDTGLVRGLVELDAAGRIAVDAALRTTARGLCAAGNVRQGSPHRAAAAMGDGAAAAVALDRYLATGDWPARAAGG
ncbi:MAG TPA: FAD-dependent oxidoreductase [Gammaproteobacteria bacterium]